MKKLALISGLLFLVVYLWVNTCSREESTFDVVYPSVPVSSLSVVENALTPETGDNIDANIDNSKTKYTYLIVASFNEPDQAKRMAEQFGGRLEGELLVLPPSDGGYYRVSYGRYQTTEEALTALEYLKNNNFPDAWLLTSR